MSIETEGQEQKTAAEVAGEKFDRGEIEALEAGSATVPALFLPTSMGELMEFSKLMAITTFVPAHLRGKSADCLAVAMQAFRWEMDPFAVANKTYFVNNRIAFEAQLINAVVNTRAPLEERLKIEWSGEGNELECTVTGTLKGDSSPKVRTVKIATITTQNSPLWKQDPEQQIGYYTTRQWARLYCPEVLLGVYAPDEIPPRGPEHARDVTPDAPKRSDYRADLQQTVDELAEQNIRAFDIFDHFGEGLGVFTAGPWIDRFAELAIAAAKDDKLATFTDNNAETITAIREEGLVSEPAVIGEAIAIAEKVLREPTVIDVEPETADAGEADTVDTAEEHVDPQGMSIEQIQGKETTEPEKTFDELVADGDINAAQGTEILGCWWKALGGNKMAQVGKGQLERLKIVARKADAKFIEDAEKKAKQSPEIPFDDDTKAAAG